MRAVLLFTVAYTLGLFAYGQVVESPLTNLYTGINVGLFCFTPCGPSRWLGWGTCWAESCW